MANAKQVLDVHVSKGITVAQSNEHMRNWTEKGWKRATDLGNYDTTREHLNFEVVSGGKIRPIDKGRSIPERMAELLHKRGIKDPNEGLEEPRFRTVVNIIFGGSRTRMQELAFGKQEVDFEKGADNRHIKRKSEIERWAKDVYSFVCGRYGEQNIAAFIVHLDELNPHVHCTLLPIKDGKFAYKEIFAGKDKYEFSGRMKQLHTDFYAEVNSKWGMSRGSSVSETGKKHRSTEEYRRMLSEECSTIEENISRHQQVLSSLHSDIRMAERRVKGLTSMVENLKKEQAEKEAQLSALKNDMEARKGDAQTLSAEKEKLENELAAIQNKLADKQEKLQTADRQLSELKEDKTNIVANLTPKAKAVIRRDFLIENFKNAYGSNAIADMLLEFAGKHMPERLADIENGHNEVYEKRHQRIEEKKAVLLVQEQAKQEAEQTEADADNEKQPQSQEVAA